MRALVAIPLVAGRAFVLGKLLALLAMLVHKTVWAFSRSEHLRVLLALAVLVFVAVRADVVGEAVAVLEALVRVRAPLVLVRTLVRGKLEARPLQMLKAVRALLRRVHRLLGHALVPRRLEPVRAHLVLVVALRLPALAHLLHKLGHLERALVAIPLVAGRAFVLGKLLALLAMLVHKTVWAFSRSEHLRVLLALAVLVFVAVRADVVGEAVAVLEAPVTDTVVATEARAGSHGNASDKGNGDAFGGVHAGNEDWNGLKNGNNEPCVAPRVD